jgi:hypothetical protein
MQADARSIRRKAREFQVYRAGDSVGWDCTAAEIFEETGIPVTEVRAICARRGWPIRAAVGRYDRHKIIPVDAMMEAVHG